MTKKEKEIIVEEYVRNLNTSRMMATLGVENLASEYKIRLDAIKSLISFLEYRIALDGNRIVLKKQHDEEEN